MRLTRPTVPFALLLLLAGCAGEVKPEVEDHAPLDGKADSFRDPTEHGELAFGVDVQARLSEEARFHAWEFTLSGEAAIELALSSPDPNLDTVMYLYRREREDASWGRYVARSDDDGERLTSAIRGDYGGGAYRMIVKGYEVRHRGPFTLRASCGGAGCAAGEAPLVDVPAETGFTDSCAQRIQDAVSEPRLGRDALAVRPRTRAGLAPEVLLAVAHYDEELSAWREYAYDEGAFTFDVDILRLGGGTVVTVAYGGDESLTDYLFDGRGALLAYFVNDQSPRAGYFCGEAGDEARREPPQACLGAWMSGGVHDGDLVEDAVLVYEPGGENPGLDARMAAAVGRYEATELRGEVRPITVEYVAWEDDGVGGSYLLYAAGYPMVSYAVVDPGWGQPWVVFESSENDDLGAQMVCVR